MLRLSANFFGGLFLAAMLANAVAVYWLHDVDTELVGRWNVAYRELSLEALTFSVVAAGCFLLLTWTGKILFRLPGAVLSSKLALFSALWCRVSSIRRISPSGSWPRPIPRKHSCSPTPY